MDTSLRRSRIREAVQRDGFVRSGAMSEIYGVAPVTIHRDLGYLASIGALERVRGGARRLSPERHEIMSDFVLRSDQATEGKGLIAQRALDEIPDGATVFFDSSTTVLALALQLDDTLSRGITVVTNSPAIAYRIHAPYVHVILTPGDLEQSLRAITGRWTAEFLSTLSFATAFVSAAGLTVDGGIMTNQRELAEVNRTVFARSERHVALIDAGKFDTSGLMSMAALDELDLVITDDQMNDATFDRYSATGLSLVRACGADKVDNPGASR